MGSAHAASTWRSLPPDFDYPDETDRSRLLAECVLPVCRARAPFSMIGVRKLANPALRLAGDSVGPADMSVVERICAEFPDNRFLVSMLSRENQHGLCCSRKFASIRMLVVQEQSSIVENHS